ncbi:MAG: alpha/beta hydrolase [Rhodoferax sp.]|nr:alpha/beta hydrolase [Rhodoferax sp.]
MSLTGQLLQFANASVTTAQGVVQYRRATAPGYTGGVTHVLLHGIGSASGNWLGQLLAASAANAGACDVLAWDAPGYGASDPLSMAHPRATDYASRMWAWLDALSVDPRQTFTLVGHSLGALMAAAATVQAPQRVHRLVLLAPAQGYGNAEPEVRQKRLSDRLAHLAQLGPAGMARKRAPAMLSAQASSEQLALVEQMMAAIDPDGYTQAAQMLSNADLASDLARVACPVTIASGSADTVTPPEGCEALARQIGTPYVSLGAVGHSCALEAAAAVNALLGLSPEHHG